jgi:universal stress protein A
MAVKKILFCTDFSESSLPARHRAVEYARALGADLLILNVAILPIPDYPTWTGGLAVNMAEVEKAVRQASEERVEIEAGECASLVSKVSAVCRVGTRAADEIVAYADERAVDLIIMGTHGWTGFKHLMMGSTAENVVRTANCPVLTVKSPSKG